MKTLELILLSKVSSIIYIYVILNVIKLIKISFFSSLIHNTIWYLYFCSQAKNLYFFFFFERALLIADQDLGQ
jgi:hypothetical protein